MKIKDLKKLLENYPEDALVLVEGYEGGLADISRLKQTKVQLNFHTEEYMGPHEEVDAEGGSVAVVLYRELNRSR